MDASNWIVASTGPADEIRDQLTDLLREGDALIVIGAGSEAAWAGFTDAEWLVDPAALHHRHKLSPYVGSVLPGVVEETWLRGVKVYDRGRFARPRGLVMLRGGRDY